MNLTCLVRWIQNRRQPRHSWSCLKLCWNENSSHLVSQTSPNLLWNLLMFNWCSLLFFKQEDIMETSQFPTLSKAHSIQSAHHRLQLDRITSYYIVLHRITSYYIVLHRITSYYIVLHRITSYDLTVRQVSGHLQGRRCWWLPAECQTREPGSGHKWHRLGSTTERENQQTNLS